MAYWLKKIKKHGDEHVEILLIGNKIDLINSVSVSEEEAERVAEENNIGYFQTSAKDSSTVDKAFKLLLSNIIANKSLEDKINIVG